MTVKNAGELSFGSAIIVRTLHVRRRYSCLHCLPQLFAQFKVLLRSGTYDVFTIVASLIRLRASFLIFRTRTEVSLSSNVRV